MAVRYQVRRDTAANWTSNDPTLADGEFGYETDTNKLKVGDGSTAWSSLAYYPPACSLVTASNQGVGGVGVYKQKTGADLEFKNINAGSNKIIKTLLK